ncbi:MAG TPA: hypothetical protein PLC22_17380 [Gordonia sp. (in: high G+C Gram-positive bacteria)]|nr:hypothetical protein [Gordonia sp. (in: high G+C Gram-positive bacteria)]
MSSSVVGTLTAAPAFAEFRLVPVVDLDPHPHNPRRHLGELTELAASIARQGVLDELVIDESGVLDPEYLSHRAALERACESLWHDRPWVIVDAAGKVIARPLGGRPIVTVTVVGGVL